jgi:hypothetical protein
MYVVFGNNGWKPTPSICSCKLTRRPGPSTKNARLTATTTSLFPIQLSALIAALFVSVVFLRKIPVYL